MRLAILLHGIVGGMGGRNGTGAPADIVKCYKTMEYNILSHYDCDIFAHTWSIDHAEGIENLYNPNRYLFETQKYFGYDKYGVDLSEATDIGTGFRTMSRYESLKKANELKLEQEEEEGFKYDWVLATRYDLVYLNKLDLNNLNCDNLYICKEPHWPDVIKQGMMHDIIYLSSSVNMDNLAQLSSEMQEGIYNPSKPHVSALKKALNILGGDTTRLKYVYERYTDIDTYRQAMQPETNPVGASYGNREAKIRLEKLLDKLG